MTGWDPAPAVVEAEKAVIGAAMLSRDMAEQTAEIVSPGSFHRPAHQTIFAAVMDLAGAGRPTDPVAVATELTRAGELGRVGGTPYLHTLVAAVPTVASAGYYAELVAADAIRRATHAAGVRVQQIAEAPDFDPAEHVEAAYQAIEAVTLPGEPGPLWETDDLAEVVADLENPDIDAPAVVPTGYVDLDQFCAIRPGQLVVIGARPGQGKSVFGVSFARHVAHVCGDPVLLVSLEMPRIEVQHRIIAAEARILLDHLERRDLTADERGRLDQLQPRLDGSRLLIDDTPAAGLAHLRARLRWMTRQRAGDGHTLAPRLVVVDYLQLLAAPPADNRVLAIGELTRGLKLLAREFDVPIVVLAQLNRGLEQRVDKRPQLADLRESGSVEQDADIVLFLYRPEVYEGPESGRSGEIDVIVAKQRQGPTGTVTLAWQGHYGKLANFATEPAL